MTSYIIPTGGGRFGYFEDEDTPEAVGRMASAIKGCPLNSVATVLLRGNPNDPRWKKALGDVDPHLTSGAFIRMASPDEIKRRMTMMDTQTKIYELTNETYVNRVRTSDKQTKAVMDFIKG